MTMKINVGLAKKIGLANYGSIGANCNLEFEADQGLLQDQEGLRRNVRNAYAACSKAVNEQLARQQAEAGNNANGTAGRDATLPRQPRAPTNGNGSHGNGNTNGTTGRGPSEKQMTYLRQLAGRIAGLGVRKLDFLANRMFGKPLATLSSMDASGLVDILKSVKAGETDLDSVLGSAAS